MTQKTKRSTKKSFNIFCTKPITSWGQFKADC